MLQRRVNTLRKILKEKGIDGILVSNFYSIFYLTGFKTLVDNEREAWLLVTKDHEYIFTDMRYSSQVHNIRYVTPQKRLMAHLSEIIKNENIKTLGFEAEDMKFYEFANFKKNLEGVELVDTLGLIIKLREIKDDQEIMKLDRACQIGDECLTEILKTVRVGDREKEIAFRIEFYLKKKDYDLAFYPIVAVDSNSAIPHYDTRNGDNRMVGNNSVILFDFGAKYENYLSDMTRVVFAGKPTDEMIKTYNDLLSSQKNTLNYFKVGRVLKDVDRYCRDLLIASKLPDYPHSTGHGVGLEIHEYPKISYQSEDRAEVGQIVTVEPGIYINGKWGMRIEDTAVIKKDGAQALTKFGKDLLII